MPERKTTPPCAHRLALGTVQFGMGYGISGDGRRVPEREVREILRVAAAAGIGLLDTARAYGEAEEVLGELLPDIPHEWRIVTKLHLPAGGGVTVREALEESFATSLSKLKVKEVHGLLFHDAGQILGEWGDDIVAWMREKRRSGLVRRIGVSVYTPREAARIIDRHALDLIQFPINVVNQDFLRSGMIHRLKAAGVELHARSVFLQGLLLMPPESLPPSFAGHEDLRRWHAALAAAGATPLEACLSFARSMKDIDHVLIGVHDADQLRQCLKAWNTDVRLDFPALHSADATLKNPGLWK